MIFRAAVIALIASLVGVPTGAAAQEPAKVVLHLRWDHQFQFAGFYAALWQGYYRQEGLDVEIHSAFGDRGIFRSAIDAVRDGDAQFGIGAADVLTAVDEGAPLSIVMPVFQRSPVAFYALRETGLRGPSDLVGRSVATRGSDGVAFPELQAMLRAEGIDPSKVALTEANESPAILDVLTRDAEVAAGTVLSVGWIAKRLGAEVTALYPSAYGVDFYGDSLFVRRDFLAKNTETVRKFVSASIRGWFYALTRSVEIADRISRELPRRIQIDDLAGFNRFQASQVEALTRFPATPLGHSNVERWRVMHGLLAQAGQVRGAFDPKSVFLPESPGYALPEWVLPSFVTLILVANVVLIALLLGLRRSSLLVRASEVSRRAVEAQLQAFIENAPFTATIRDLEGRYLVVNRHWSALTGVVQSDALGRTFLDIAATTAAGQLTAAQDDWRSFARVVDSGRPERIEVEFPVNDGESTPMTQVRFPIRDSDGSIFAVGAMMQDVSEQRRSEKAREVAEAQMRALVDNAPLAISVRDLNGRYLSVNAVWMDYFRPRSETVIGSAPWELVTDPSDPYFDLAHEERADFEGFIANPVPRQWEAALRGEDGTSRIFVASRFPVCNASGEMVAVGTVSHDVSELRRLSSERAVAEAQMQAFVENAPLAVSMRDMQGRYLAVNSIWKKYFARDSLPVVGMAPWDVFSDPDDPLHEVVVSDKESLRKFVSSGGPDHQELDLVLADGSTRRFLRTRFIVRDSDGGHVGVGTISQDLAELHRIQGEREVLEAQMRAFIERAPFAITIRDTEGRYIAVNRQWERFLGLSAADVIGRAAWELATDGVKHLLPGMQNDKENFEYVLSTGQVSNSERVVVTKDRNSLPVMRTRFPIRNKSGAIIAVGTIMQDLTERQRIEQERARIEAQLRAFIDHAPFYLTIRDPQGRYIICNRQWRDWSGLSEDDFGDSTSWDLFSDPDHPMYANAQWDKLQFEKVLATGEVVTNERRYESTDGSIQIMSSVRFPIRDEDGSIIAVGNIMADQTAVHVLGRARAELEAQFKAFIDNAPTPVTISDVDGTIRSVNPAFLKAVSLAEDEVIGRVPAEVVGDEYARQVDRISKDILDTGEARTEEIHARHRSGRDFTVSLTRFPLRNELGKIVGFGTISIDIAEAHRAKLALEASENRYRNLVEMSPEAILVHEKGQLVYANDVARRWMGGGFTGPMTGTLLLDWIDPEDAKEIAPQIAALANDTTTIFKKDFKFRMRDGTQVEATITSAPIEFDGRPARQLMIHDVSERKRMEAQLVQNAKLATIGELSAGILHELAQPLNIARMAAQAALRRIKRLKNGIEDPAEQFELIESQMARMAGVIDHMRVFSRAEQPDDEVFDARNAIRSAVQMVKQAFASEGVDIRLSVPKRRVFVRGRTIGLEQVVLNLLSNARDAITFSESTADGAKPGGRIDVALEIDSAASALTIKVADTGGGIPNHVLPRLFDTFFTTKPVGRGTGLGLPVCQSIVKAMSGEITAVNSGVGAVFSVRLPIQSADARASEDGEARIEMGPGPQDPGSTVLLVDDEQEALQLMADFFEEIGFDVCTASNGEEALRRFRGESIDLLVTDIRLPIIDGIELAQRIRAGAPNLPIVFVTGHVGFTESLGTFRSQRNVRLLNKPIDLNALEQVVGELTSSHTKVLVSNTKN